MHLRHMRKFRLTRYYFRICEIFKVPRMIDMQMGADHILYIFEGNAQPFKLIRQLILFRDPPGRLLFLFRGLEIAFLSAVPGIIEDQALRVIYQITQYGQPYHIFRIYGRSRADKHLPGHIRNNPASHYVDLHTFHFQPLSEINSRP